MGTYQDVRQRIKDAERRLEDDFKARGKSDKIDLLLTLPGVSRIAAITILAELGDLSSFRSDKELSSWAGMCPGNNESAGKRGVTRTRKGNKYLKRILCEVALAATRSECYFKARFQGFRHRMTYKKAVIAIANKMLKIIYQMLTKNEPYKDHLYDYEKMVTLKNTPRWMRNIETHNPKALQNVIEGQSSITTGT